MRPISTEDTCRELDKYVDPIAQDSDGLARLLSPAYERGDGSMEGAQLINGEWWHPLFGCDSLQYLVDKLIKP